MRRGSPRSVAQRASMAVLQLAEKMNRCANGRIRTNELAHVTKDLLARPQRARFGR